MTEKNICPKGLLFLILAAASFGLAAQTVTLTFTAKDAANHYVQLNRVIITNLTKSWQETIYWPDTVLTMQNGTGIDDHTLDGGFALSQNNPNPFSGTTEVSLTTVDEGKVDLDIKDMNGRIIETHNLVSPQLGNHQFRISLSTAGTYVMTARQNGKTSSIKMICNGGGGSNTLDYLGMVQTITVVLKSSTNKPFNFGDQMEYVGYAFINNTEAESQRITQAQGSSQLFTLQFAEIQAQMPTVVTYSVSNITANTANCGGNVTDEGYGMVTARGVCWSTSQIPTVSDNYTTNGSGTGGFSSSLTGLTPGTTYYVRAYATNSAGTAYGEERSFTTSAVSPTVTTDGITNITSSSASCGGNVTYSGGASVIARGVCWSRFPNPTTATGGSSSHTTDGSGLGGFTSEITGLYRGTTYYVRAYATNYDGTTYHTAYGEERTFTTSAVTPTVTTTEISPYSITMFSADCGGTVTDDGGASVTIRGVCWSTSHNPTITDSFTTNGSGVGNFTSSLSGLTPNTIYYVRAYATNSTGTGYGNEVSFTTKPLLTPTVTTNMVTDITDTTATCGGNVTYDGGTTVTERGILWSIYPNPTFVNCTGCSHVVSGNGTGGFTVNMTSLLPHTPYYVRAYATNSQGTSYGETKSFTTTGPLVCGTSVVSDYDGNIYQTVKIGSQCWMKENMHTYHYSDGTSINSPYAMDHCYVPYEIVAEGHGYLYDWQAATRYGYGSDDNPNGVQGVCPPGWHLPSKSEWLQLTDYVSSVGIYSCDNSRKHIGKALVYNYWSNNDTCPVAFNATGFSARLHGYCSSNNTLYQFHECGLYWTSTFVGNDGVEAFRLSYNVGSNWGIQTMVGGTSGLSVRCVSDESLGVPVTLRPYSTNFSENDWILNNGNCTNNWHIGYLDGTQKALYVTSDNSTANYSVTSSSTIMAEKDFVMPTDDSVHVEFDVQIGGDSTFDYLKAFLVPSTVTFTPSGTHNTQSPIDYANYAVNFTAFKSQTNSANNYPYIFNQTDGNTVHISVNMANPEPDGMAKFVFLWRNDGNSGTQPGAIITSFSIGTRTCPGTPTVTDYDGNIYNTIQLGDQCWLRENMRTTRYSDGTIIPLGTSTSATKAYRYCPDNNPENVPTYGYLYNWRAAMGGTPRSEEIPSVVQGICPIGWHIPTATEWDQMKDFLSSQSAYNCNENYYTSDYYTGKSIAHQDGWTGNSAEFCKVCNMAEQNNSSGLGLRPAGSYDYTYGSNGSYNNFGSRADYWLPQRNTSAEYLNSYSKYLDCSSNSLEYGSSTNKGLGGRSVRCVRGNAAPTVTTLHFSGTNTTTAEGEGAVISDGGFTVSSRGVCWSTSHNPTVNDNHTVDGMGVGHFTSTITGLTPRTTYYVRTYATNCIGTVYGDEAVFTTYHNDTDGKPCPNAVTVADVDNNIYPTVQLGAQCWMAENLRTTHYADGTYITYGEGSSSSNEAYRYCPYGASINLYPGGFLYNWTAVMGGAAASSANPSGVQGICPDGWHLPSKAEWTQLLNYVSGQSVFVYSYSAGDSHIAYSLANPSGWKSSNTVGAPGCQGQGHLVDTILRTGFSAFPAQSFDPSSIGQYANFWTSTDGSYSGTAFEYYMSYNSYSMSNMSTSKSDYLSVRCVKNTSGSPSSSTAVTTSSVTNLSNNSATCGGCAYSSNSADVTARGVCWSTLQHPTITDNHTNDGSGTGTFSSTLTGIRTNTLYYVRAYISTNAGTYYGNERSFSILDSNYDAQPCIGSSNVDNIYNTVQIGTQCWMKENLRTTHYTNGTPITLGNVLSDTTAYYYYPGANMYNMSTYGLLYNWKAAFGDDAANVESDLTIQGVCPTGWHLPRSYEWENLVQYVGSQSKYQCGGNIQNISKALAATTGWIGTSPNVCTPSNELSSNNATGFTALPAYYKTNSSDQPVGSGTHFWACTSSGINSLFRIVWNSTTTSFQSSNYNYGCSIRCLRDALDDASGTTPLVAVTTGLASSITTTSALLSGTVFNPENAIIIAQGFQWKADSESVYNTVNVQGDILSYSLTGLNSDNNYKYRTFATTAQGSVYGPEISFATMQVPGIPCPGTPTVTDYDGNIYNTVKIGQQCWMKENLRTTHYANSVGIPFGTTTSSTVAYRYAPNSDTTNVATYGYLYNGPAIMNGATSSDANPSGVQGICPPGWHVPNYAEWDQLINYVSSVPDFTCGGDNRYIAKALAATFGWSNDNGNCTVGNDLSANDVTGFSALPSGYYCGSVNDFGTIAYYWGVGNISNSSAKVNSGSVSSKCGISVRCLRDDNYSVLTWPSVFTNLLDNITDSTATCGVNVLSDGGATVTERGVCWSTSPNPTTSDNHTTDGSGIGSFTSNITGLLSGTIYYMRAYATNSVGTSYGDEITFTTHYSHTPASHSCPGMATVTDYDGNTYNTVLIGNQCWMKENLRTTHYANGASIPLGSSTSVTTAYCYYPNSDSSNVFMYGYLYNWPAVMHGTNSSSSIPSCVQGICPNGWHVPSDAEWTQLTDYVSSQSQYVCGESSSSIAKALASHAKWNISSNTCAVGNVLSDNNATGFSALPAGNYYSTGNDSPFNTYALFWSTTGTGHNGAYCRHLSYYGNSMSRQANGYEHRCSVRCIWDGDSNPTDGEPCPSATTVTDYDGNTYNTVLLGEQCWMKENLRTTHYANGVSIPLGTSGNSTTAYRYYPDNNSYNVSIYGYLYNWPAVMHGTASSTNNPSGVQGICPVGWHVPSNAEWTQLENYVSSQCPFVCVNNISYIAKALASTTGWISNTNTNSCAVGNNPNANNSTGFSALPAAGINGGNLGYETSFWSATESASNNAHVRFLWYGYADVEGLTPYKDAGNSVRCLKD